MIRPQVAIRLFLLSLLFMQSLFADYKYSYIPKYVYPTQHFAVTIVDDSGDAKKHLIFRFDPNGDIKPISNTPIRDLSGGKVFYTFYFKAKDSDLDIPKLTITDQSSSTTLQSKFVPIKFLDTTNHKNFCSLMASSCKITSSQVSEYDGHNNLISIVFRATEANPENIKIANVSESGIEKLTQKGSESIVEYYFVLPSSQKSITLSYFNTIQNRFISKTISTDYEAKSVAAQETLNPKDSSFDRAKKYGLIALAIFFFWMFWLRKEKFFLILFIATVALIVYIYKPNGKICIQEGASLYIIPTENSTTSFRVPRRVNTEILNNRNRYYKVDIDNKIGWIKDEDLCKN